MRETVRLLRGFAGASGSVAVVSEDADSTTGTDAAVDRSDGATGAPDAGESRESDAVAAASSTADRSPAADDVPHTDELPEDLDISGLVGPYEFPNNSKRRVASVLYFVVGVICIGLGFGVESPLVNGGLAVVGIGLVAFAVYSWAVAVDTAVDEADALVVAARTVGLVPGHASAQMTWRGWRSRPVWRILLYSDEEQPLHRALVVVDGVSGDVIEHLVEDNPEDWSDLIA